MKKLLVHGFRAGLVVLGVWVVVVGLLAGLIYITGEDNTAEPSDVIVVLGSGLRRDGQPGDALRRRSTWAAQLYRDGIAPAVICTGGIGEGQRRSEASACAEVLQARGVPLSAIYLEESSRSTEENAIFAREIIQANNWQTVTLVTDSFHMLRASWMFDHYDIAHHSSAVPREWVRNYFYVRHFSREILALHWQAFKQVFNIDVTNFG